jgi:hypothetical protein
MERKVFAWIVRHLRWVARMPGSTHLFDAALFAATAIFHPRRRAAMEALEELVIEQCRCTLSTHWLGGSAYRFGRCEIAHLHGNGLLDVRLDRATAGEFITTRRAEPHHVLGRSTAWVSYWIESNADLQPALDLIEAAAARISRQGST